MWSDWLVFCEIDFHSVCPLMEKDKRLILGYYKIMVRIPYAIQYILVAYLFIWASLVAQLVKNPPAMWETWVLVLGWEDPQEKGTATHSSILAWWTRPCSPTKSVSPSVNLSHQEVSISLLSLSIRGQTDWKPQSQKTSQSDHMDHSLV